MATSCIFCGAYNKARVFQLPNNEGKETWFTRCQTCGTGQPEPMPDIQMLSDAHEEPHHGPKSSKFIFWGTEFFLDFLRGRKARQLARRLNQHGAVLDYGCGNGRFLYHLAKHGHFQLYGSELPGKQSERAARISGAKIISTDLNLDPDLAQGLEAVTMFHVLEHLPYPKQTLQTITNILKPGGWLIISIPNIDSFQAKFFGTNWLHLDPERHVFFPTLETLTTHLSHLGLTRIHLHTHSLEQNPFGMLQSTLNALTPERDLLFKVMKGVTTRKSTKHLWLHWAFFFLGFPLFVLTDRIIGLWKKGATATLLFQKSSGTMDARQA